MLLHLQPNPSQKPPQLLPRTPKEFRQFEIKYHSIQKLWTLDLKEQDALNPLAVNVVVIDGHRHPTPLQFFPKIGKYQCSCDQFFEEEADFCEHIAAIENSKQFLWLCSSYVDYTLWMRDFQAKTRIIERLSIVCDLDWYDSYGQSIRTWKSYTKPVSLPHKFQTVSVTEFLSRSSLATLAAQQSLDLSRSSEGVLNSNLKLYDFQEEIFKKMLGAKKAICSMKMGSGKTLTTIACLGWVLKNEDSKIKALIIGPKSLKLQWKEEFKRALGITARTIDTIKSMTGTSQVDITTYQFFVRHIDWFLKQDYQFFVVDEIQFLRNNETKIWKAAKNIKTKYFFGLSGTVIENKLDDLYSIMDVVAPGRLGAKWRFQEQFQNLLSINKKAIVFKGAKNISVLRAKLADCVFSYDNLTLPNIDYNYIPVTMNKQQRSFHDTNEDKAKILLAKSLQSGLQYFEQIMLQGFLLKARQACNTEVLLTKTPSKLPSPKISQILILIQSLVSRKEKIVLFSEWTEMLDILSEELKKLNFGHVFFTGRETEKKRQLAVKQFSTNPEISIFLSSDAGGVGLDGLQLVSSNIIHSELPWNPAKLDQRNGRLHRLGQLKDVSVHYFFASDSIEHKLISTLNEKRSIREIALQGL